MASNGSPTRGWRRERQVAVRVAAALLLIALAAPAVVWAAPATLDFGTVSVGATKTLGTTVPLTASLSDLPPDTVLYVGGNPAIDFALALSGLSVPLTAGALYAAVGEVTATYHLSWFHQADSDYSIQADTCATGTGSCAVDVTFAPTEPGLHLDTLGWTIFDLQVTGGGTFADLIQLMASFIGDSFAEQLSLDLTGIGVPSAGSVAAQVNIAASAACIELSTSSIDFGNLSLGDEDQPASPSIVVTNCSGLDETLYARGTDATGTNSLWSLVDNGALCADTLGLDNYRLNLASTSLPAPLELSTENKAAQVLSAGEGAEHVARIFNACPGSTGAGRVMSMSIHYLVTGG